MTSVFSPSHSSSFSPPFRKNPKAKVPYHYYEPKKKSECFYVKKSEMNPKSGHKFLTEHAMFARWSTVHNITFRYPSWNISEASGRVGSYYLKKYKNTLGKTLKTRKGWDIMFTSSTEIIGSFRFHDGSFYDGYINDWFDWSAHASIFWLVVFYSLTVAEANRRGIESSLIC